MRSVYIHIPFCKNICSYCDFCKFYYNEQWASNYLNELEKEIKLYYENDIVNTIYIGGGTPSSLSYNNIIKLLDTIKIFKLNPINEITFECNINDINEELLAILKVNNINRLSIGIQSFNNKKLKYLDRQHSKKDIKNKIRLCKSFGFDNINVDFMYGLPIETYRMMKKDFENILKLSIEHISTYSLIIEDHTKIKNNNDKNLDEDIEYKMYKYILKKAKKKNYNHYEVSNFALNGYESTHNKTYWKNNEYYGFGLSSHGFINNVRYENTRNLNKYLKGDYRLNEIFLSTEEDMQNQLILGFRLLEGININEFNNKYNKNIEDVFKIEEALKRGLLVKNNNVIKIPESKIYIMNEILNLIL